MLDLDYDILKEITLLYVEDDQNVQDIYSKQLKKKVGKLICASDGEDGYNQYIKHSPDMILTDIQMPKVTGIEMVKKIRSHNTNVAIFITTAHNNSELIAESLYLNICGYLVKPINKNELFAMLVGHAKLIVDERKNIRHVKMLQSIIDADTHMLAVTDLHKITFANKTFINYLNLDSTEQFNDKYNRFTDIFLEQDDYIHNGTLKDEQNLMELMLKLDDSKKQVMIFDYNSFNPKAFSFKLTPIDRVNNKDIYLATFIDVSSQALERVQMKAKAYKDNLTNIYNRNKVDEVIQEAIARTKRYNEPFSMILIDIDHFKKFNDTYGHLIGDEVLISLAQTINKITRETDTFARWGGEEFVMILANTTKENGAIVAENLRRNVEKIIHPTAGGVTASFGVTQYMEQDTEKTMYERCDEALYKAKQNGRNRVEVN